MKNKIFLFLLVFLSVNLNAQVFKNRYEKDLAVALKAADAALDTFDFTIPPIERVPISVQQFSMSAVTNWGKDLLLPADVVKLMRDSCKYPVVVKILDTGSKQTHADLQLGQLPGANYTSDQGLTDGNGHGTHVAGIIAAKDFGLLWPLVQLGLVTWKPVQILAASGSGNFSWVTNAINTEYANDISLINSGKRVVYNGSFGGGTVRLSDTEAALKKCYDKGVSFVFANGNTGMPGVQYPGNSLFGLGTSSLNSNLTMSSYTSTGPETFFAMPGAAINSTYKGNTYAVLSGTSMASPGGTSAVALALSRWGPVLDNQDKRKAYLAWVASDLPPTGKDSNTGNGIEYFRNILTKNPKDMGNVPVPPPPPPVPNPPKDSIPVKPLRTLYYSIEKEYTVVWGINGAIAKTKTRQLSKSNIKSLAYQPMKVKGLKVSYQSTTDAVNSEKQIKGALDWFFNNRGFMLTPGMDENDAIYWTAYFCKLMCKSEKKIDLQVLHIESGSGLYWDNPTK